MGDSSQNGRRGGPHTIQIGCSISSAILALLLVVGPAMTLWWCGVSILSGDVMATLYPLIDGSILHALA